jgi:hypothetical protein
MVASVLIVVLGPGSVPALDRPAPAPVKGGGAVLIAAVRGAQSMALERLGREERCRQIFAEHGADGARLLLEADYRVALPNEAGGLCEQGASAFTGMTTGRTALCQDAFLKLPASRRAIVLLHEALHVAGMGQHPIHPGAMTARQINGMVASSCDL